MADSERTRAEVEPPSALPGPLHGLTVLDLSRVLAGPWASQILGDLGAEVWKIERPETGDDTRLWGPPFVQGPDGPSDAAYYLCANRNKRSAAIDFGTPVPGGPINRIDQILADPQVAARGLLKRMERSDGTPVTVIGYPSRLSRTPATYRIAPQTLGEATAEMLASLGIDEAERATLRDKGIIRDGR